MAATVDPLGAVRDIVGLDHVRNDDVTLERYARSTAARMSTSARPT